MSATDSPIVPPPTSASRNRWTLIAVCAGTFMLLVDVTIVQVALPTIQRHLGASFTDLQWVIDAYALSLAALILTWGSISTASDESMSSSPGSRCSRRPHCSAVSPNRSPCSSGRAPFKASARSDVRDRSRPHRPGFPGSGAWQGDRGVGATVGGAVAIGPLVGGLLTSGIGWRWIFIVNVPIGAVAIWLSSTKMRNQKDPGATRLDGFGLVSSLRGCSCWSSASSGVTRSGGRAGQ